MTENKIGVKVTQALRDHGFEFTSHYSNPSLRDRRIAAIIEEACGTQEIFDDLREAVGCLEQYAPYNKHAAAIIAAFKETEQKYGG